jgi:hypothetical protein
MRIIQVGTDRLSIPPRFGGAYETYIYGISRTLARMGHEAHVISFDNYEREYEEDGIIYHTFSLDSPLSKILSKCLGLIDVVLFSYNDLDYASPEERIGILHEIGRVLKKGDSFIFSSHNLYSITRLLKL